MKRHVLAFALCAALAGTTPAHAVFDDLELGPQARGLGGCASGLSHDATGIAYNPAGLHALERRDFYASMFQPFGAEFTRANFFAFAMPTKKWGSFGVGYTDFRVEYQDVTLSVERSFTVSHAFLAMEDVSSSLAFGYSLNVYNLDYPTVSVSGFDLGSETAFGVDVGVQARLHERTTAGVFAKNVNNPQVGDPVANDLPQRISGGIAYRPYDGVITAAEIEKTIGEDVQIHGGLEFEVAEPLVLRAGAQTKPSLFDVGAGIRYRNVLVDVTYTHHPVLDATLRYGLGVRF